MEFLCYDGFGTYKQRLGVGSVGWDGLWYIRTYIYIYTHNFSEIVLAVGDGFVHVTRGDMWGENMFWRERGRDMWGGEW